MKLAWLPIMVASVLCCGCRSESDIVKEMSEEATVTVRVSVPEWSEDEQHSYMEPVTRAGKEMLYPMTVLVIPEGGNEIIKTMQTTKDTEFAVRLASGTYDLFVVCGLTATLPSVLSEMVEIPSGKDFAVGFSSVTVYNGVCIPAVVEITAERQMTWLEMTLTDVPKNIASLKLYVKGLYDRYQLDEGWKMTSRGTNHYTLFPLKKSADNYTGSGIIAPYSAATGVTFFVESTTVNGNSSLMKYTSSAQLTEGVHLMQTLSYGDLMIVEGGVNLSDWTDATDDGTLSNEQYFHIGDQYFSQAATVVGAGTGFLQILAHKPMTVTLDEVRNWDCRNIPYTLSPEINVKRWAFPDAMKMPKNTLAVIKSIGWDVFDEHFASNSLTPIDRNATNVLAYYDNSENKFYRYDFVQGNCIQIEEESGEWLVYPYGIIQLP